MFREDLNGWLKQEKKVCHDDNEGGNEEEFGDSIEERNPIQMKYNDGESLVTIIDLDIQLFEKDASLQRENIFNTKCNMEDQVCNLIVDSDI